MGVHTRKERTMSRNEQTRNGKNGNGNRAERANEGRSDNLRDSAMMAHLLDAMEDRKDIGHYGRLTFAMAARHFMRENELVKLLSRQPGMDETEARALVKQCEGRDYNPPSRERVLEWQAQQEFPICPTPDDPNSCNVYRDLRFPEDIYENIQEFYEEQAQA
jgi:hypothetical protein